MEISENSFIKALKNVNEYSNPIFVVGPPRCGTGLTVRALSLSPNICFLGESEVLSRIFYYEVSLTYGIKSAYKLGLITKPGPLLSGIKLKLINKLNRRNPLKKLIIHIFRYCKIEKKYSLTPSNPIADTMMITLSENEKNWVSIFYSKYHNIAKKDPIAWIRIMFEDCRILSEKDFVIEKTPLHILCIPLIYKIFPKAKIIITFRKDLKEILASYYRMAGKKEALLHIITILKKSKKAIMNNKNYCSDRAIVVYYEEWITNPKRTWLKICNFANIHLPYNYDLHIKNIKKTPSKFEKTDADIQCEILKMIKTSKIL